ncbi:hypothetical protein CTI12_AA276800 [Artemisia annua]|uniref:Homologous recombination OB-fold protein OB-fold domain-containing protein n=1 Tax=Artemisia annua TaxID=35608 RepID=A0A2U1NDB3_ARTAN|nr:hypothetical protein CTI12_AA276800 [Artemisia annua]
MNSPSKDEWEQLLDIDDSDLRLSATTQNVVPNVHNVRKIPGPACIVQTAMIRKNSDILEGVDAAMTQEYIRKVVDEGDDSDFRSGLWVSATEFINGDGRMMVGVFANIQKFCNKGKVEKVVAITKSCTSNVLGDLAVTLKDVSGLISCTIHHKVLADEILAKALTVGAVLVLKTVSVFSLKQSGRHYLNITIRNVVKVFYNDEVVSVTVKA